ncbi:UNVERIFIED_ORG: hypothetical protein J3D58_002258 [Paenarthrobacter nicotinovorans]
MREVTDKWLDLLKGQPEELAVQQFLELHPSMIPGGSGDIGPGGHHGSEMSAVFREPKLKGAGRSFQPDFMWVTRSTSLITPILIEIEKPSKRWYLASTQRPTAEFRDALDQLTDWASWFKEEGNESIFRREFLFLDSYDDRPIEPQFVLIYGRQAEFEPGGGHADPSALRYKRDTQRRRGETFMTFDSLQPRYDHRNSMTLTMTAKGPRPFAFSPVFGTDTNTGEDALLLGDPSEALERSVMMAPERKRYLLDRWEHWRRVEEEARANNRRLVPRQLGFE